MEAFLPGMTMLVQCRGLLLLCFFAMFGQELCNKQFLTDRHDHELFAKAM